MAQPVEKTEDEKKYERHNFVACFCKTLPTTSGKVCNTDYKEMRQAILSDSYPTTMKTKLIDPRSSLNILKGKCACLSPYLKLELKQPAFDSEKRGEELLQLYAMSLIRDVKFVDYDTNPLTIKLKNFFRDVPFMGRKYEGPLISQLLIMNKQACSKPIDYMTTQETYNEVHSGVVKAKMSLDKPRYIINLRDLAEAVHNDYPVQFYHEAAMWMTKNIPTALINPYANSPFKGFLCFNLPFILCQLNKASDLALQVAWYYKWQVHRGARPEEMAYEVNALDSKHACSYRGMPNSIIFDSFILDEVHAVQGNVLLSQAYPEGAPAHPSFPAGHACIAGACVTLLKAFFDTDFKLPNSVVPNSNGSELLPWEGMALTLGNELDKLAENVAFGRAAAGVHFKSDNQAGLILGESIGLQLLKQCKQEYRLKDFDRNFKWKITTFDGEVITI